MRWTYSLALITTLSTCSLSVPSVMAEIKLPVTPQSTNVLPLPHTEILYPVKNYKNAMGSVLIYDVCLPYEKPEYGCLKRRNISIHANFLPTPSSFGDYDGYAGFAQIPQEISWTFRLLPVKEYPHYKPIWSGYFELISATVTKNVDIQVRLYNSKTRKLGPVILESRSH